MQMMELDTERLRIVCLDIESFRLYIHDHGNMQRRLGVEVTTKDLPDELKDVFIPVYEKALAESENYAWYTVWQIIDKQQNQIIGGICFKGCPNLLGEVEIGYGTDPAHQNKGFMTEAVKAIIQWAVLQEGVSCVIAETEKSNIASHRVLEKNEMTMYKETDSSLWWLYKNA